MKTEIGARSAGQQVYVSIAGRRKVSRTGQWNSYGGARNYQRNWRQHYVSIA
jgi:hypothetical protein